MMCYLAATSRLDMECCECSTGGQDAVARLHTCSWLELAYSRLKVENLTEVSARLHLSSVPCKCTVHVH